MVKVAASLSSSVTLAGILAAGCLPDYGEAPFACVESSLCPPVYPCVDMVCRRGATPAAGAVGREGAPDTALADHSPHREATLVDHSPHRESATVDVARIIDLPGGLTCKQIDDCYGTCNPSDTACFNACFAKGSPDGKAKMSALEGCEDSAAVTVCAYACNISQQACYACLDQACAAQIGACFP
jgi:hypothetical protein